MTSSCSDHGLHDRGRIMLESVARPIVQLFSAHFFEIFICTLALQAQYLVRLEGDACCSAHCK